MTEKYFPIRTCIVCRQEFNKKDLIRVVKNKDGLFLLDNLGKLDGRGAYLCKNPDCIKKLQKTKGFNKAFKCVVPDEIYKSILETYGDEQ